MYEVELADGYSISDDRGRLDMGFIQASLASTYWAADRPAALTERSWAHCLGFGLYDRAGQPVGFGRVLTDYALRAHIGDVFLHPAQRGLGLGKALIASILAHPALASVEAWTLTTADAHGLYERFGFRLAEPDGKWMVMGRGVGHQR
ncbi:hypothetical protein ACOSOMT5_P0882 [Acidiphilium sp. MT5]